MDGDLATDGRPVAVIEYTVAAIEESTAGDGKPQQEPPQAPAAFAGRQYALADKDGESFTILTCMAPPDAVGHCDDALRDHTSPTTP